MFKNILTVLAFLIILSNLLHSEFYRVYLKDKGNQEFSEGSELYNLTLSSLSREALERRKFHLGSNFISLVDAPIYEPYIKEIEKIANIHLKLRWKNYLVVNTTSENASIIKDLPFVNDVHIAYKKIITETDIFNNINYKQTYEFIDNTGFSKRPIQILNADKLHKLGLDGNGVIIGIIDSGFEIDNSDAFESTEILDKFDFIQNDRNTSNEFGESSQQSLHGTMVLSLIGGYKIGKILGIAPKAKFLLAKTELITSENRIEEDMYAAAVEWMEAKGVDIINTSLSYYQYDILNDQYNYSEMDGKTTIVAQAANMAVSKGVIFFTSAGNSGPNPQTIGSPADSPDLITVGAMKGDSLVVTAFSSRGPNGIGEIKPDIIAPGFKLLAAGIHNNYIFQSGTSFSSPIVAGAMALILQLNRNSIKNYDLKEKLYKSASLKVKNNNEGWGLPNFYQLAKELNNGIIGINYIHIGNSIRIFTYSFGQIENVNIKYFNDINQSINIKQMKPSFIDNQFYYDIPLSSLSNATSLFIQIYSNNFGHYISIPKENDFQEVDINTQYVSPVISFSDYPIFDSDNKILIWPNIVTKYNEIIQISVNYNLLNNGNFIEIFDSLGKSIHKESLSENFINEINIDRNSNGRYFVVIRNSKYEILKTGEFTIMR